MPRDLEALAQETNKTNTAEPELTKSPDDMDENERPAGMDAYEGDVPTGFMFRHLMDKNEKRDSLHPYVQVLTPSDVDSCTHLEEEAFPPNERATREKFTYRLKACGHLSLGIFTSHDPNTTDDDAPSTVHTSTPVYSGAPTRKSVLLGHIIATKTTSSTVTDADMAIPDPSSTTPPDPLIGHKEEGRTLCIHSLAVLPQYQRRGLGNTLLKAYLQRMETHGVADSVALISHEALIPWYENFGFENRGKSKAEFGGGGWWDLVRPLKDEDGEDMEEVEEEEWVEELDVREE